MRLHATGVAVLTLLSVTACGSPPPPKVEEPMVVAARPPRPGRAPQVAQELGSIDQKMVELTFAKLQTGALQTCHSQGRDRVEFLTGDVSVFLRIDGNGKVKYAYFEDSTIGDRDTEKCMLGVLADATWPKPEGGEAEVRSGFGWGAGGEREPTSWASDMVTVALVEAKDVRGRVERCKKGITGDFRITGYVVEAHGDDDYAAESLPKSAPKHKDGGGRFKALGVAAPNKEGAETIDCIVDALRSLELPSPGDYAAKVTFSL